jgi:hypothetical protein
MIGVAVTAVMVSAVVVPSGAIVAFVVAEHDPPFLSQVATVEPSEYFAKFSKGSSTEWSAIPAPAAFVRPPVPPLPGGWGGIR